MNRPVVIAAAAAAVIAAAVGGYLWLQSDTPDAPSREPGGSPIGALPPEPEAPGAGDPAAPEADPPGKIEIAEAEPESSPPSTQSAEPGGEAVADPAAAPVAGLAGSPVAGANPGGSPPDPSPPAPEEPLSAQAPPAPAEGTAAEAEAAGAEPGYSPPVAPPSVPGEAASDEEAPALAAEGVGAADIASAEPGYSPPVAAPSVADGVPLEEAISSPAGAPDVATRDGGAPPPGVPPSAPAGARPSDAAPEPDAAAVGDLEDAALEPRADRPVPPAASDSAVADPGSAPDVETAAPAPRRTEIARAPERGTPMDAPDVSSAPPSPGDAAMPDDNVAAVPAAVEPRISRHGERSLSEGRAVPPDLVAMLERETAPPRRSGPPDPAPPVGAAAPGEIAPPSPDEGIAGSNAVRAPVSVLHAAGEPKFETTLPALATMQPRAVREPAIALPPSLSERSETAPPAAGVTPDVPAPPAVEDSVADSPVTDSMIAPAPLPPAHAAREPALAGAPAAASAPRAALGPDIVVAALDSTGAAQPPAPAREARPGARASAPDAPAPAATGETVPPRFDAGPGAQDVSRRGGEPNDGAAPAPVVAIAYEESDLVFAGKTTPGALVEAWIDGRPVGAVAAGPTGNWRLVFAGNEPGQRRLRVTATGSEGEVELLEDEPIYIEDATRISVVGGLKVVQVGSNLWRIAREVYGRGARNMAIYEANRDQIRNPDVIFPGQILILPGAPSEG